MQTAGVKGGRTSLPYAFTEADVIYYSIYKKTKKSIIIVDDYINIKTFVNRIKCDAVFLFIYKYLHFLQILFNILRFLSVYI